MKQKSESRDYVTKVVSQEFPGAGGITFFQSQQSQSECVGCLLGAFLGATVFHRPKSRPNRELPADDCEEDVAVVVVAVAVDVVADAVAVAVDEEPLEELEGLDVEAEAAAAAAGAASSSLSSESSESLCIWCRYGCTMVGVRVTTAAWKSCWRQSGQMTRPPAQASFQLS